MSKAAGVSQEGGVLKSDGLTIVDHFLYKEGDEFASTVAD